MKVRDLQDGAPGGWIAPRAFRVDKEGSVWVDLDAEVLPDVDPEADLLQIRRNQELFADESGLKLGSSASSRFLRKTWRAESLIRWRRPIPRNGDASPSGSRGPIRGS